MKSAHSTSQPAAPVACLSIEETAKQLCIGRSSVYALIKSGQLASIKLGRRRVIPASAIQAMIDHLQGHQPAA